MSVSTSVLVSLGSGLSKWLAKRYLGDLNQELSGDLIEFGKVKIPDLIERRNAARQFERYADEILKRLMQSLETRRKNHPELDDDAICRELSETLNGRITKHFLVAKDLDPRVIAADLRQRSPLTSGRLPDLETHVYQQVLDEIVRYILEVASLLPTFQSATAAESLKRLSNLGQDVIDVLNTVQRLEARVIELDRKTPDARWEADYRAAVIRTLDRVELFGADIPPEAQRNLLTEAFVSLNVDAEQDITGEPSADLALQSAGSRRGGLINVDELLQCISKRGLRVLICGSAGCGKTTLLRWAAIEAAKALSGTVFFPSAGIGPLTRERESKIVKLASQIGVANVEKDEASEAPLVPFNQPQPFTTDAKAKLKAYLSGLNKLRIVEVPEKTVTPILVTDAWSEELLSDVSVVSLPRYYSVAPGSMVVHVYSAWRCRIPFFVPLRNCQDGRLPRPEDLPLLIAKEVGRPQVGWVRRVLTEGRALVMLDGIDEVPSQNRGLLKEEIKAIVEAYPYCMFVLTSRPTAISEDWLKELRFINADVSPMSMLDVERFVKRWHEATGKELARQGRADGNLATDADRLIEQFNQNPPLSLLATNPLLCAMICALHRVRHHKLPESQYELCETLCHMLLHKREREGHLNWQEFPAAYIALTYEQKRGIAQQLARWLVHSGQSAMPLDVAYEQVARALHRIPGRTPDEAPLILKTLVERSGLLREPNPDLVDFLHNTFKELLAGDDLAVRGDAESVMQHLEDESWRRVALFGVASPRSQSFADLLVERVLGHIRSLGGSADPETDLKAAAAKRTKAKTVRNARPTGMKALKAACRKDKSLLRTVLFVLQCRRVAKGTFLEKQLDREIEKLVAVPFPPADFESAEAIAQLGDEAIDLLIAPKKLHARQSAATARALRLINTAKSRSAFESRFIDSTNWEVLTELAQVIHPLTIPAVVNAAQHGKGLIDSICQLIQDVSPLAGLTNLRELYLNRSRVTDVSPLAGLTNLQVLNLSGTVVTDLTPLAGLTNLRELYLNRSRVTDVSPLVGLTNLQVLNLSGTVVTDVGHLARLTSLKDLFLSGSGVTDLTPLAGLSNLRWLDLTGKRGETDISPLARLTSLQFLYLGGTSVANLTPLAGLKDLRFLYLNRTSVVDLNGIGGLTSLERLDLNRTGVTDVRPLAGLTSLQRLDLNRTGVTDLRPLAGLTSLDFLNLNGTNVTDVSPLMAMASLEKLYLSGTRVTDVSPLAGLTDLEWLDLSGTKVTDVGVIKHLKKLTIYGYAERSDIAVSDNPTKEDVSQIETDEPVERSGSAFQLIRLDLANWHGFERRTFEFSERVTVLIGNNGTGKSSSLEAVVVALAGWCGGRVITDADLRRVTVGDKATPRVITSDRTSVRCAAMWNGESFDWLRLWENRGPQSESLDAWWAAAQKAQRQLANGVNVILPVMAYYPASRSWRDVKLEAQETQSAGSPWDGYTDCFAPAADLGELKRFMKSRQWFVLQAQRPAQDLEAVQKAVVAAIGRTEFAADRGVSHIDSTRYGVAAGDSDSDLTVTADAAFVRGSNNCYRVNRFEYDVQMDELMIGFDDGQRLSFGMLSDGQRTTIALVADIARRAATLNPHLGADAAAQSPGIVLIDEIELHLHPRWQRTIVGDLRDTFPQMQFVITTHSPLIIQSCRKGEVINLDDTNDDSTDNAELRDFTSMSPEDILELEQGMSLPSRSQRMLEMKKAAEQYYAALRHAESTSDEERERLKELLDELEEPFTDDPAFSAFLRLKRAAAGLED